MIDPNDSQLEAFLATDQTSPVIFINCHRYYPEARYPENYDDERNPTDVSGREAYHRYFSEVSMRFVPVVGGRMLVAGPVDMVLIGEGDWDEVIMGLYPSKEHAFRIPAMPGYDDIAVHRKAGLAVAQTMVLSPENLLINTIA